MTLFLFLFAILALGLAINGNAAAVGCFLSLFSLGVLLGLIVLRTMVF